MLFETRQFACHQILSPPALTGRDCHGPMLTQAPRTPSASALHQQMFPERQPRCRADLASLGVGPAPPTWEKQEFCLGGLGGGVFRNLYSPSVSHEAILEPEAKGKCAPLTHLSRCPPRSWTQSEGLMRAPQLNHVTLEAPCGQGCLHATVSPHE